MQRVKLLPESFYLRSDVVQIARELLGKILITNFNSKITSGIIVETEAYQGITDRASHAWNGRRTARTEIMYAQGGTAYIYLCYGIHSLFNVVTNQEGTPHAVLIRALEPLEGIDLMIKRRKMKLAEARITSGPGSLSKALGIHFSDTGENLRGKKIWIEDHGIKIPMEKIISTKRVGVDYAGVDANLPYRFLIKGQKNISRPRPADWKLNEDYF